MVCLAVHFPEAVAGKSGGTSGFGEPVDGGIHVMKNSGFQKVYFGSGRQECPRSNYSANDLPRIS